MNSQQLVHEIEVLPPELQKQVVNFVAFLRKQQLRQRITKRTVGQYRDKIGIAKDFDEPLSLSNKEIVSLKYLIIVIGNANIIRLKYQ